jgi:hypothetical protein
MAVIKLPLLRDGDHLDQRTYHQRYEAMPEDFHAELIGGIVHLRGRHTISHGRCLMSLSRLFDEYVEATPGTEGLTKTLPLNQRA